MPMPLHVLFGGHDETQLPMLQQPPLHSLSPNAPHDVPHLKLLQA
jgi:hypothetical protein